MKNSPKNTAADIASDTLSASEARYAAELEAIGARIGYGRSCQILGDLWDQMLERAYGLSSTRGKMERRRDIEVIEAAIRSAALSASSAVTNEDAKDAAPQLIDALQFLLDQAESFNIAGVYFHQFRENRDALDTARAALASQGVDRKGAGDA